MLKSTYNSFLKGNELGAFEIVATPKGVVGEDTDHGCWLPWWAWLVYSPASDNFKCIQ